MSYSAYWKIRKQPFLINWKALGNAHEIMFCFNDIIQKTTIILGGYQSTLIAKPDNYMAGVATPASLGFPLSYHRRVVATKSTTSYNYPGKALLLYADSNTIIHFCKVLYLFLLSFDISITAEWVTFIIFFLCRRTQYSPPLSGNPAPLWCNKPFPDRLTRYP